MPGVRAVPTSYWWNLWIAAVVAFAAARLLDDPTVSVVAQAVFLVATGGLLGRWTATGN